GAHRPWGHAVVAPPVCASFSRSFATVHHVIGGQNRCGSSAVPNVVSVDASEELSDSVRRRTRMVVAWWSIIPFVLLLGCIAVLPLIPSTEKIWDRNLVILIVALVLGIPIAEWFLIGGSGSTDMDALLEYVQCIVLLGALFRASGGIFLVGDIKATPRNYTSFLAVGGALASFIVTTGAAMLLIRP